MKLKELLERATPRPWRLVSDLSPAPDGMGWGQEVETDLYTVAMFYPGEETNNALLTVHAVNVLPELVAALKGLAATARTFRNVPKEDQQWTSIDDDALDNAFAVIEKATNITRKENTK